MTKYRSIFAIAFIMGTILALVFVARLGLVNLGMIAYSKGVMPVSSGPVADTYAQGGLLADSPDARLAVNYLMAAQKLGQSAMGQWALARSEMAVGKMESAAEILQDLRKTQPMNPLLYQDTLITLSQAGKSQEIISIFEQTPPVLRTLAISDTVAAAYLKVAQQQDDTTAQPLLRRAIELRPGDLFLNEYFWKQPDENNHQNSGTEHRQALTAFPINAIYPANDRLIDFIVNVVPRLRQEGIWGKDQLTRVIADLSWHYSSRPELRNLLRGLAAQYPQEPEWQFYLGEVYQRDGDIQRAQAAYEAALQIDPDHAASIYRRGSLYELMGKWAEAQTDYLKYQRLAADDLAGLAALARISDKLGATDTQSLRRNLDSALDDRRSAAQLLHLAASEIEVGPNIMVDPGYEDQRYGKLANWAIGDYLNGKNDTTLQGAFVGGADSLEKFQGQYSARIDGLWRKPELSGSYGFVSLPENPRGAYWIKFEANQPYLVSGLYKTNSMSETGQVDIGNPNTSLLSMALPGTDAAWHKFAGIACLPSNSSEWMQLVLQLITPGQIWFDQIKVQPVSGQVAPIACNSITDQNQQTRRPRNPVELFHQPVHGTARLPIIQQ